MEGDAENLPVLLAENLNQSFEQLVLRYQDQLYAFVLARVGEASTAEEIVQSALIRAYYALRQYPPERIRALKLSAWLYEITRNTLYNERRDHQACAAQRTVEPFDLSEESPLLLLEDQRRTPDEELS